VSRGTMGLVTGELAHATEADVNAMAAYVVSLMGPPGEARKQRAQALLRDPLARKPGAGESALIYESTCLPCHDGSRPLPYGGIPLALSLGLTGESPRNLINVIVHGMEPAEGEPTPMMPGYGRALADGEVEALVQWLRENLTDKPRWEGVAKLVSESRAMKANMLLFPPGGTGADPANPARP
jgi:mono/diheme cytochrome c family protein